MMPGFGNFHKTLPHNAFGEVESGAFDALTTALASANFAAYEAIPSAMNGAKLVNPMAGLSTATLGPNPDAVNFPLPPAATSDATAAEMTELYWMAILRDLSFDTWENHPDFTKATLELKTVFTQSLHPDGLKLGLDLPQDSQGNLSIRPQTLFRLGLVDEDKGPIVSQFFLHDVGYGTQTIIQKQFPYAYGQNFLRDFSAWLKAQNEGRDLDDRPYPDANSGDQYLAKDVGGSRIWTRISCLRDLARFVHKDALHQAYFNAALLLLSWDAPLDKGNPYTGSKRQAGFGSLGGPHLLTLVSEVASRALQAVWLQKWQRHLRLRPEAYGGLMQVQGLGVNILDAVAGTNTLQTRAYGLPEWVFNTQAAQRMRAGFDCFDSYLLPMAFSSGSPAHPAYGAGHATVAGACVTILKAWFDETMPLSRVLEANPSKSRHPLTGNPVTIVQPGAGRSNGVADGSGGEELLPYQGADLKEITIGGELNKIAANVAMGRSYGGVHWRSDNSRSLRLGERIAAEILADMSAKVAERDELRLEFLSFDRQHVIIQNGQISVGGGAFFPAANTSTSWPI